MTRVVTFIFGKPGGGKSYLAVRRIIEELRTTTRSVITNLPLSPGNTNAYLQTLDESTDCGAVQRIIVLTDDETREFWRHRHQRDGQRVLLDEPRKEDGATPPWPEPLMPALYVLDEIHIQFNARAWAATGRGALWYLSQHRKMGDDVILVSQNPEQVDRQLRMLTQDWVHCRNLGKEQLSRFFKLPRRVLWRSFASQPTSGRETCQISGSFGIDEKGLGTCYQTMAGVGIMATDVKEMDRRRGMPFWMIVIPILLVAYGVSQTGHAYKAALGWITGKAAAPVVGTSSNPPSPPVPAPLPGPTVQRVSPQALAVEPRPAADAAAAKAATTVSAVMSMGRQKRALLSTGEWITPEHIGPGARWIVYRGDVLRVTGQ